MEEWGAAYSMKGEGDFLFSTAFKPTMGQFYILITFTVPLSRELKLPSKTSCIE
jgi:hypothetical protein